MVHRQVYLAGPVLGCTEEEAKGWRKYVANALEDHGIIGVSPLRCEPLHGERYSTDYPDPRFGSSRAIAAKNKYDVQNCNIILAYLPKEMGDSVSLGTIGEIFWADAFDKQVILVSDHPKIISHPLIDEAVDWKLDSLEDAIDVIAGVMGAYVPRGKNL